MSPGRHRQVQETMRMPRQTTPWRWAFNAQLNLVDAVYNVPVR